MFAGGCRAWERPLPAETVAPAGGLHPSRHPRGKRHPVDHQADQAEGHHRGPGRRLGAAQPEDFPGSGAKREAILQELAALGLEKQKLSRWLRGSELTPQTARFVNTQIDELCEQETRLQEQQWALEDQITELQKESYNAEAISNQLKDFAPPVCGHPWLLSGISPRL